LTVRALPLLVLLAVTSRPAFAQGAERLVTLTLRDARSRAPLIGATAQVARGPEVRSDSLGVLTFTTRRDSVWLEVRALGYAPWQGVRATSPSVQELLVQPVTTRLQTVEVRSRALGSGSAFQAAAVVGTEQLAERMAPSIAAVIAAEPGVNARTNGPMASQPVIRGLTGDRVLVLEDGMRMGDIATTAPDHAVTVDPATAQRIEVIRGPAGLLYGSNTLGGVVNVVRDDIPRARTSATQWDVSTFGEQVNRGVGGSARVHGGAGPLAWSLDGTGRQAADTRGPNNVSLPFTDLEGFDAGAGVAVVGAQGHAGVSAREYRSYYGVPSSFAGVTLPGAHDGGVYVDIRRSAARADAEWRSDGGAVEAVSLGANGVRFEQSEFEQGGFVGTRFGQLAASGEAVVRLRAGGTSRCDRQLRAVARSARTGFIHRHETGGAAHERTVRGGRVHAWIADAAGGRAPGSHHHAPARQHGDAAAARRASPGIHGGHGCFRRARALTTGELTTQIARAFRPPSIEELYSRGSASRELCVRNRRSGTEAERGTGADAVLRWRVRAGRAELSAYTACASQDYVAFAPQVDRGTGLPMRDPRLRRYVVYRPQQVNALPCGAWS
jgi:iron complex outermembrane recepter protein